MSQPVPSASEGDGLQEGAGALSPYPQTPSVILGYRPSLALAISGAVTFGLLAFLALGHLIRWRRCVVAAFLTVGSILEALGYLFRASASQEDPYGVFFFLIQFIFIVSGPAFFMAAVYLGIGFLIDVNGQQHDQLSRRHFVMFILCTMTATVIQIIGAAVIAIYQTKGSSPAASDIALMIGLVCEVFLLLALLVFIAQTAFDQRWQCKGSPCTVLLLLTSGLLLLMRTCVRLAETCGGLLGYLTTHEVYFGCFEFVPIALAVLNLNCLLVLKRWY